MTKGRDWRRANLRAKPKRSLLAEQDAIDRDQASSWLRRAEQQYQPRCKAKRGAAQDTQRFDLLFGVPPKPPPKPRTQQSPKIKKPRRRVNPRRWWSDRS